MSREERGVQHALIRSALATYKLEQGCADCGYDTAPEALDFDHVIPGKTSHIGRLAVTASLERVLDEMDLCEVVCSNCHRIRTSARRAA